MRGLTWLHISDWHQGASDSDRTHVGTRRLMRDIADCRIGHRELAEIDLVVISGDVANGGRRSEYRQAVESLLKPLAIATGLRDRLWHRLIVVPGNHDLDRRVLQATRDGRLLNPLGGFDTSPKKREAVKDYLSDHVARMHLLSPFRNFREFVMDTVWGKTDELRGREPAYYQFRRIVKDGVKVGVVGLNSALLSNRAEYAGGRGDDYGHLVIGELAIDEALDEIAGDDIRIAVMHHPISWLADFDRDYAEERLFDKCHFVLYGHQHLQRVHVIASTIGDTVNIPAGTVYNRRFESNKRYMNSYNLTHIDFDTMKGTVYLRRWDEPDGWVADANPYRPDGRFHFNVPKRVERAKDEVYQRQVSKLVGNISRRFCESYVVRLKTRVQTRDGVPVVRQEVSHRVELAPGAPETFTAEVELSANNRLILPRKSDGSNPPGYTSPFSMNGLGLDTYKVQGNKLFYSAEVGADAATLDYSYVLYMSIEDFFVVRLKRFTNHFKLEVEKDASLSYEFVKLGDIPARPYRNFSHVCEYATGKDELCSPGQGLVVHWYSSRQPQP